MRIPITPLQVTEYSLDPEVVDLIVFCSKIPVPMLKYMDLLNPIGHTGILRLLHMEQISSQDYLKQLQVKEKSLKHFCRYQKL